MGEVIAAPVDIRLRRVTLPGDLSRPAGARAIVLFAHGSGSDRHSPRNRHVAHSLRQAGLATLLFDLLTDDEDLNHRTRLDVELLTERLRGATQWLLEQDGWAGVSIGYFGASTGAAAALAAAAALGDRIQAVVSRGGRPDLADSAIDRVKSPTLLIVGERDRLVLDVNERSRNRLAGHTELVVVPGAGHLFEEPGALEEVSRLTVDWFLKYLKPAGAASA
jgi:pimeloyl-ACP methyl ester carboxylesterase